MSENNAPDDFKKTLEPILAKIQADRDSLDPFAPLDVSELVALIRTSRVDASGFAETLRVEVAALNTLHACLACRDTPATMELRYHVAVLLGACAEMAPRWLRELDEGGAS